MHHSKERVEAVHQLLRKFKDLPNRQLARLAYKQHRHLFSSLNAAQCAVRHARGNRGNKSRQQSSQRQDILRPNGKADAGYVWDFPRSSAPSYGPFTLEEGCGLVLSDLHIPFHDRDSILACIEYARKRNPDFILLNGDICDFFSISRFDKNPAESSLKKEINLTRQFLGWLRQQFPAARIIYKLGNHDEWFDKYLFRKAPELYGVDGMSLAHFTTAQIDSISEVPGIEWVDDQKCITYGKLKIWHGHEIGKGSIAPPVNPARGLFLRTLECGIMGHLHKDSAHNETSAGGKLISCWSTGCLCGLWPRYARVNKWTHSAIWLELKASQFSVIPLRILNGRIL